jgi:hypothetical protein
VKWSSIKLTDTLVQQSSGHDRANGVLHVSEVRPTPEVHRVPRCSDRSRVDGRWCRRRTSRSGGEAAVIRLSHVATLATADQ